MYCLTHTSDLSDLSESWRTAGLSLPPSVDTRGDGILGELSPLDRFDLNDAADPALR